MESLSPTLSPLKKKGTSESCAEHVILQVRGQSERRISKILIPQRKGPFANLMSRISERLANLISTLNVNGYCIHISSAALAWKWN